MVQEIFNELQELYQPGIIDRRITYYFSVDENKYTIIAEPEGIMVSKGKTIDPADCVCVTTSAFFLKIWEDGYRPGLADFAGGKIKSNNPNLLITFMKAFGRM